MLIPPSRHFTPLLLDAAFNADRRQLDGNWGVEWAFGSASFHGVPFALGHPGRPNVVLLAPADDATGGTAEVRVAVDGLRATYLVVLHAVEDRPAPAPVGIDDAGALVPPFLGAAGNELGDHVADYVLV